jgi:hypothetical protein
VNEVLFFELQANQITLCLKWLFSFDMNKCMLTAKANLSAGMDSIINGYIAFMAQNRYFVLMNTGNTYLTK